MSAYVSPTNWGGIKATLLGDENNPGIDNEYAELIIALLQMAENRNPDISPRILELADELKLLSIQDLRRLNAELVNIAQAIGAPSKFISVTEQNVKWWRTFTTYLFGAGVAIAVINAFVPIQFGLIAQTVFATGLDAARVFFSAFSGTSAPATAAAADAVAAAAAAAAAGTGPSMVAGPDLGPIGSLLYTSAVAALITCKGAAVSFASTAASAACRLMSLANAEKVADLAVQAATVAVITVGIDKGLDWIVKFYRGDFDAAIALAIDQGIFNAVEYSASNATMEAAYDIVAANATLDIKMSVEPAWSKLFIPPNRFLDVDIMDIIRGNLEQFIEILRTQTRLSSQGDIMSDLSALDREPLDPNDITRLKPKYGMGILILYMLLSQKSKPAKSGFGYNPPGSNSSGSSSLPEADMFSSKKMVNLPPSADSMSASVGRPGLNPYIVDYNLKTKILHDAGYKDYIPFVYIPDFQGTMSDCMKQVLGCLYNEAKPGLGNIFTRISRRGLSLPKQKEIFDYMSIECKKMTGDPAKDIAKINEIADGVRDIMAPRPSAESAAESAAASSLMVPAEARHFANIANIKPVFPSKASATKTTGFSGNANPRKVDADVVKITGQKHTRPKGGRKSRRYKKRKATLKRRRIRRRSTRKGRKRRHTKRR